MLRLANQDIRAAIKKCGARQWQIAELYGSSESHFSRMLRRELPPAKKAHILQLVKQMNSETFDVQAAIKSEDQGGEHFE